MEVVANESLQMLFLRRQLCNQRLFNLLYILTVSGYTSVMSADVDKIKDKLSIVEVVSSYVKLEKAGRTFKGKSPFNVERTPSFHVDPEKNLFHCFSSGKGGDIFTFIQEVENVDFQGALKILADKAGVTLTQYDGNKNDERSQLYEVLETATKLYEVAFRKDPEAIAYMEDRGLSRETMKDFRIGYAPAGWQYLVDALKAQGFPDGIIEKAGLGLQGKKGLYDRFRERIMFPIMDGQGKVVAFTGRIFVKSGSDTDPTKTGKYVNSPETPVYHKSKVLYGFDKARRSMMQENACIVVEGQMDLIMSHQAGVIHSVALSGTALTDDQVAMIQRFTDSIIFALDADKAGIAAVKRSIDVAYARDMATSVIAMKNTKDPADLVKEDPELWQQLVTKSVDYIDFRLATVDSGLSLREKTKVVHDDIFPSVQRMGSAIMRDSALQKIAHFLSISVEALRDDFTKWEANNQEDASAHQDGEGQTEEPVKDHQPQEITPYSFEKQLLGIFIWQEGETSPMLDLEKYKVQYKKIVGETWFDRIWAKGQNQKNSLIFESNLRYSGLTKEALNEEVEQLLAVTELRALEKQSHRVTQQLRQAEQAGDDQKSTVLLQQHQEFAKRISELKNKNSKD